mgnify:CR=1 FL=1
MLLLPQFAKSIRENGQLLFATARDDSACVDIIQALDLLHNLTGIYNMVERVKEFYHEI